MSRGFCAQGRISDVEVDWKYPAEDKIEMSIVNSAYDPSILSSFAASMPGWFKSQLDRELRGNERVLWVGQPQRSFAEDRPFFKTIIAIAGFGILLLLAAMVAWVSDRSGMRWNIRWAARPMLSVGSITLIGCAFFIGTGLGQRHVFYAVTNQRVLIWPPALLTHGYARSISPAAITECTIVNRSSSLADLILFREAGSSTDGTEIVPRGFFAIRDAEQALALISSILSNARSGD